MSEMGTKVLEKLNKKVQSDITLLKKLSDKDYKPSRKELDRFLKILNLPERKETSSRL